MTQQEYDAILNEVMEDSAVKSAITEALEKYHMPLMNLLFWSFGQMIGKKVVQIRERSEDD